MRNPIVTGFSPDPSVCRVGGDYFLATSTLNWWPGIPIRHSTDLVHWETIGHAVTRPAQYRRDGQPGPLRLYAPTLRYHGGKFHLACTNVADGQGNFLLSTTDPAGEWSDAVWVDREAFDPSLTFDGDDVYYTRRTVIPGKEGSGPVIQAKIDVDTGRLASPARRITPGEAGFCSNDIEGPHLYRIGQWWYLLSAEGGTWKGHMATIARSRNPWGPFEGHPGNPILTHRHRVGHPIQSTGHAELVDDVAGRWWAVFLGTRHHAAASWHHLGRETFLAPVVWRDGWPVIGDHGTVELQVPAEDLPPRGVSSWPHSDSPWTQGWSLLDGAPPGVRIERLDPDLHSGDAVVTVPATDKTLSDATGCAAAFVRQQEFVASFEAEMPEVPASPHRAGVTVFVAPDYHYDLTVAAASDQSVVADLARRIGDMSSATSADVGRPMGVPASGPITLRIEATPDAYRFLIGTTAASAERGSEWREVGRASAHFLASETTLSYYGASFGVFAEGAAATFTVRRS